MRALAERTIIVDMNRETYSNREIILLPVKRCERSRLTLVVLAERLLI
jgi:hypothetical protein